MTEMSERTKNYVKELVRLGPDFDHATWLKGARAAEQKTNCQTGDLTASEKQQAPRPEATVAATRMPPKSIDQSNVTDTRKRLPKQTKVALKKLVCAWGECQRSRQRDAIYDYLTRVFSLIQKYRQRGQLKQLVGRSKRFARLSSNTRADAYTAVIRATTRREIDHRAVSKYSRTLRFCYKHKGDQPLEAFIKGKGGINACVVLYAQSRKK